MTGRIKKYSTAQSDPYRPLNHPINAGRLDYFAKWRKSAKRIMVWDYWNLGGYLKPPQPCTVVNAIAPDFKFFRDMRVTDVFVETGRCWVMVISVPAGISSCKLIP